MAWKPGKGHKKMQKERRKEAKFLLKRRAYTLAVMKRS